MPASYKIITDPNDAPQSVHDLSFKGGLPNIPDRFDVPRCQICGAPMTFFFQIAFPKKHVWDGRVMAAFECTSLEHPCGLEYRTVDILYMDQYAHLDDSLLDSYQKNFRFYVFNTDETTQLQDKFDEKLVFERLAFERVNPRSRYDGMDKVGGEPAWKHYQSTEEGADRYKEMTYMGGGFDYLMQMEQTWRFKRLPHTPLQHKYSYFFRDLAPGRRHYIFFGGSPLKFLGTSSPKVDPPRVLMYSGQ